MTAVKLVNVPQPAELISEQFELLDDLGAVDGDAKTGLIEGNLREAR
jgi:hypothetical protein